MSEKKNYKVVKEFSHEGKTYAEGETFRKPDEWEVDEGFVRQHKTYRGKDVTAFNHTWQLFDLRGRPVKDSVNNNIYQSRRYVYPVI